MLKSHSSQSFKTKVDQICSMLAIAECQQIVERFVDAAEKGGPISACKVITACIWLQSLIKRFLQLDCIVGQVKSIYVSQWYNGPFFHSSQTGELSGVVRESANAAINWSCCSVYVAKVVYLYDKRLLCRRWTFFTPAANWTSSRKYHIIALNSSRVVSVKKLTHESHIVTNTWYSMINRQSLNTASMAPGHLMPGGHWRRHFVFQTSLHRFDGHFVRLCRSESNSIALWQLKRALAYMMPS